ncbi:MAG: translation initiation factor IF-2 N-terminal domain-containing protein, partial [Clostridia bacterium]|nr:translation initiation factor IF-2 N-terminal domain-containing protein [Clostridia bacterium]
MAETLKLGEVSKNLKITNKDIIAKLAQYGVEVKSASSLITEETAGLIIDIYTQANTLSEDEITELRVEAQKKAEKERAKKAAEEKAAAEQAVEVKEEEKEEEPKVEVKKPEAAFEPVIVKKAAVKPEVKEEPKKEEKKPEVKKPAPAKEKAAEKPRQEKRHKVAK